MDFHFSKIDIAKMFKKIPWLIARNAFGAILLFIFVDIIMGAFIFYKYAIILDNKSFKATGQSFIFKKDYYEKVLNQREQNKKYLESFLQSSQQESPQE